MDKRRVEVFFEFLVFGILLGLVEDMIIIKILTNEPITFHVLWVIFLVALPFAFIGEYIVDRIDFLKLFNVKKKYLHIEVFLEFLIFGVLMGIGEDLIALHFSTGEPITWLVVGVVTLVAIPFSIIGEVVVDRIDFVKIFSKKNSQHRP